MSDKALFLVVGGSRGIGEAVAIAAAGAGHPVVLSYADRPHAGEAVVERITRSGGRALAVRCDASREADVLELYAKASALGRVGAMIYCTGITGAASPLADASAETLQRVLDVNLFGAMLCGREAVRVMAKN